MNCIGFLILLASYSLVSGLCSTCRDERCYDNGECIIGCVTGYVGSFCNEKCPSRCLNKQCYLDRIDGSVTCTDGCEQGYCGTQCTIPCPENCVTCDRKCVSCNVTLCPERRYGADCSKTCSTRYGKCDRETGECIICRSGFYGDECNQECTACFTRAETIIDSCLSGCDICKSKDTCPVGLYGGLCVRPCSLGCEGGCNKATGECSAGCVSGYHGLTCNYTCSEHCMSGKCDRATGECFAGCVSGYHGLTCNFTCSEHCMSGKCDKATGECSAGCVSGYHGLDCNYTCNEFCVSGFCNQDNGICAYGCVSGYKATSDMCIEVDKYVSSMTVAIAVLITIVCSAAVLVMVFFIRKKLRQRRSNRPRRQPIENGSRNPADVLRRLLDKEKDDAGQGNANESILESLKTRTTDEIEACTAGMVRVSAVDTILKKLEAGRRWITITGNAGDGKTTLGYLVLKEFLENKVNVFALYKPEEYDQMAKIIGERVIMLDDRFGEIVAEEQLIKGWLDVIRKLLSYKDNDIRVIFVSRKNVVNESSMHLGQFTYKMFDPSCIVDLSKIREIEERLNILRYHLEQENVIVSDELKEKVSNKDNAYGFPHCCKLYSKLRSNSDGVDIEDFFDSPLELLDKTTEILFRRNCKDLFEMMIKNNGKFDVHTIEDKHKRQLLLQVVEEQKGSYISSGRDGICEFAHPSLYESVLNIINKIDPLFCVQNANLSVISEKLLFSTSDEEDRRRSSCHIIAKPNPNVLRTLAQRFRADIVSGDYSVFKQRLCQSREFSEALVSCCVTTGENENCSKRYINQPGKDGLTMFWTALRSRRMAAVGSLVNKQDERGRTPLHYISQFMNFSSAADNDDDKNRVDMDLIKLIITEGGGGVNIRDQYEHTPLHYLCQLKLSPAHNDKKQDRSGMDTLKQIIIDGEGDINTPDQNGQTPLHYLFKCNIVTKEEIHWIITEAKGDLNQCEQNKSTPLHYLCANSSIHLNAVNLLISEGSGDFYKGDEHGTTPLHFLCNNSKVKFEVVFRIIKTTNKNLNTKDYNGITPLHVLCKRLMSIKEILTMIKPSDLDGIADRYGNTPLHYLSKRREIDGFQEQLKQIPETAMMTQNKHGNTPLDYLTDKAESLPWTDGMIDRSAADLVVCSVQRGEKLIFVLGTEMTLKSTKVQTSLQRHRQEMTNIVVKGDTNGTGQTSEFCGTWSSSITFPPCQSSLPTASYWEMKCRLKSKEYQLTPLLEIGVLEGQLNSNEKICVSDLPGSVCLSIWNTCTKHDYRICIQLLRRDQRGMSYQVGECISPSSTQRGEEFNFTFGLVLDMWRRKVTFIYMESGQLLFTENLTFTQEVFPMFFVNPDMNVSEMRMKLISGREISVNESKINLIKQALTN